MMRPGRQRKHNHGPKGTHAHTHTCIRSHHCLCTEDTTVRKKDRQTERGEDGREEQGAIDYRRRDERTNKQTGRLSGWQSVTKVGRQRDRQWHTDRQTERQAGRQTDIRTDM